MVIGDDDLFTGFGITPFTVRTFLGYQEESAPGQNFFNSFCRITKGHLDCDLNDLFIFKRDVSWLKKKIDSFFDILKSFLFGKPAGGASRQFRTVCSITFCFGIEFENNSYIHALPFIVSLWAKKSSS